MAWRYEHVPCAWVALAVPGPNHVLCLHAFCQKLGFSTAPESFVWLLPGQSDTSVIHVAGCRIRVYLLAHALSCAIWIGGRGKHSFSSSSTNIVIICHFDLVRKIERRTSSTIKWTLKSPSLRPGRSGASRPPSGSARLRPQFVDQGCSNSFASHRLRQW